MPAVAWDGQRTLDPVLEGHGSVALTDVIWADDLASCVECDSASNLATACAVEAGVLADAFEAHGMTLSFGPKKTALLASPKGPGARVARRLMFGGDASLHVLRESGGACRIPLVSTHRHLGALQSHDGSMMAELRQRVGAAWGAFREGRRRLYKARGISISRKGQLLSSLVLTKLFYGAGAWPPLREGEHRLLASTLHSMYRQLLMIPHDDDQHVPLSVIFARCAMPDLSTHLHLARLRYLRQLWQFGPDSLWALLRQDRPYAELLHGSVAWLFDWVRDTCELPDPHGTQEGWQAWCDFAVERPGRFKGLLCRAAGLELCRHRCVAALCSLYQVLRGVAGLRPVESEKQDMTEACIPCRRSFATRVAWAGHAARKHGYRNQAFLLAQNRVCLGCGWLYSRTRQLRNHLANTDMCRANWGLFQPDSLVAPGDGHPQQPPLPVAGSLRGNVQLPPPSGVSRALLELLQEEGDHGAESAWHVVSDFIEPLTVLRSTVEHWQKMLQEQGRCDDAAAHALDLLRVDVLCESEQPVRRRSTVREDAVPSWPPLSRMTFSLTGCSCTFSLSAPPLACFPLTSRASIPLRVAQQQAAWTESVCSTLGQAVRAAVTGPIAIELPPHFHSALPQGIEWLEQLGLQQGPLGMHSPA